MAEKQKLPDNQTVDETISLDKSGNPQQPSWWEVHKHWPHFKRRTKIFWLFVLVLLIAVGGFFLFGHKNAGAPGSSAPSEKASNLVPSPLTGIMVHPDQAKRPVTGIMIENSPEARPQSGLRDAGVVYEAIAEGGITRFLALYQEARPMYVGPVRSLRPYYIDWAGGYDASIAHVGGSPKALKIIRKGGKDLDQFFNSGAYWRITARYAPHNVYTSFHNLDILNKAKGYKKSSFTGWNRKADAPSSTPTAKAVSLSISGPLFKVGYTYNPKNNTYSRKLAGAPHRSTSTSKPSSAKTINPKVVVAMIIGYGIDADGHHSDYQTIGKGTAYIFQDGVVKSAHWSKKGRYEPLTLTNTKGEPISLNAGQVWVTAVDTRGAIKWSH